MTPAWQGKVGESEAVVVLPRVPGDGGPLPGSWRKEACPPVSFLRLRLQSRFVFKRRQLENVDLVTPRLLHTLSLLTEIGSDAFQKFLNLLGDTITLKGWTGYRGGLDTKSKLASGFVLL